MLGSVGVCVGLVTNETRFPRAYHEVKKQLSLRFPTTSVLYRYLRHSGPYFGNLVAQVLRKESCWAHTHWYW